MQMIHSSTAVDFYTIGSIGVLCTEALLFMYIKQDVTTAYFEHRPRYPEINTIVILVGNVCVQLLRTVRRMLPENQEIFDHPAWGFMYITYPAQFLTFLLQCLHIRSHCRAYATPPSRRLPSRS